MRALWAGHPLAGRRRGRLDDHAAVRQERLRPQPEDDRAQGARGGARLAARAALVEGPDPARVPEHDLLRQRRVRHPAGRADVLRQGRGPPHAPRGGAARGAAGRPVALRPDAAPARGEAATPLRAADDVRPGEDHARSSSGAPRARRCRGRRTSVSPAPAGCRPVLRQLRQGPAHRQVRRRPRLRRRPQGHEHDRPRAAGDRPQGDRERPQEARRPGRGARRDRPAHRRGARDGRRLELPREPVQPRDPGRAAARLVVQADRARDGAAPGHLADHDVRLEARRHRRRRPDLARHELRGRLPGPRRPRRRRWSPPTTRSTPS